MVSFDRPDFANLLTDWGIDGYLHSDLGCWGDGVVYVRHESRVHSTGKRLARCGESGLSGCVVLRLELEDNHITNCSVNRVRCVDKSTGTANNDLENISIC